MNYFTTAAAESIYNMAGHDLRLRLLRSRMTAIAKVLSRVSATESQLTLKTIAIFCGVWLLVSLIFISYGLDLSAGLF